jgi:hypothetical protein
MSVADYDLFTDIRSFATEALRAEIVWVVKNPFGLNIIYAVKPDFF